MVCVTVQLSHSYFEWVRVWDRNRALKDKGWSHFSEHRIKKKKKKTPLFTRQHEFKGYVLSIMPPQRPLGVCVCVCTEVSLKHSRWQTRLIRLWKWQALVIKSFTESHPTHAQHLTRASLFIQCSCMAASMCAYVCPWSKTSIGKHNTAEQPYSK